MPVTNLNIANGALIRIGSPTITALADTSKEAQICTERLEPCKRTVLRRHPWNFAMTRVLLSLKSITGAADNGAGLIRITAVSHGRTTGDYVTVSQVQGTQEANGQWTITVINANTFDLQASTFANAYVSGGKVGLAAAFDYEFRHPLPTDFVRLHTLGRRGDPAWRVEGAYIVCDEEELELKYVRDVTDYGTMDPSFHDALSTYLAWDICYAITQNLSLKDEIWKDYEKLIRQARFNNAVEEPAETIGAEGFLDSREGRNSGFVRDPMT